MLMKKFIGKPYAGKLHVRFDEGAGKVFYPSRSTLLVIFFDCQEEVFEEKGSKQATIVFILLSI